MQTVYVAGGAGFIGSHLVKDLLQKGYEVVAVDNFITSSKDNITDILANPHFHFLEKDIITITDEDFIGLPTPDFIFHLASPASPNANSPRSYIVYGIETLQVNSQGTQRLLDIAKTHNARILFASTSEVYGDPEVSPQPETYWGNVNPNGVRSVYDEAKRYGEAMMMAYVRKYNVDARIARIFNTYGPHMQVDDGRVVSNLIIQALHNEPLTVYGDGKQTRSFCYVSDLIEGLERLLFTDGLQGQVVNLGNPNEKTIIEFAEIIKKLTGTTSEIVHEVMPSDDPKKRNPDIAKAKRLLDWEPKVSLEKGITQTIEYFKNL